MNLGIEMNLEHEILVIRIDGEVDISSSDELRGKIEKFLDKKAVRHLVLDLSKVSFIDSSGLGVILGRYKRINRNGGRVIIAGLQPQVRRVMQLSGLLNLMKEAATGEEALGMLKEAN